MLESIQNLNQFILDFNLRHPNGIVCFKGKIGYIIDGISHSTESEMHIITSDNIAAIYILNLSNSNELPDMFDINKFNFSYTTNKFLTIKNDKIELSIVPNT